MKLKILKNEHYIDIVNECDFEEGSTAFTASCFLNKNIEGEFKDFSLSEENESIAKVLLCSFKMLQMLKDILDNNRQYWGEEENSAYQIDEIEELIKKASE